MDIPPKYKQLWSNWDIRVLILLSLFIQIILIFLGRLRKKSTWRWMRLVVWGSYLLADWVADFVLGQLSGSMGDSSSSNIIIAFWAPFLILHLGGPDTITAYSVEDNELWARHLLGLGYELIIASYVIFRSLPDTRLLAPTLLIFIVAIIKYIERSYSLYKASAKGFRSSIISSKKIPQIKDLNESLNDLSQAFWLYSATKASFIDDILYVDDSTEINVFFKEMPTEEILRMTSIELSYAYDEFYTKAVINHSKVGYVLRVFCSICILLAFSLFVLVPKNDFKSIDIAVTYVLLIGAICLDVVATVMLVLSDWMVITLLNVQVLRNWHKLLAKFIVRIKNRCIKRWYWSIKSPQLNLFDNQLKISATNKAPRESIMNWVAEKLKLVQVRNLYLTSRSSNQRTYALRMMQPVQATQGVLEIISSYLQRRLHLSWTERKIDPPLFSAVHNILALPDFDVSKFAKIFEELPHDLQVLIWHITTDICFHHDSSSQHPSHPHRIETKIEAKSASGVDRARSEMEACKYLSNYMMHTAVMQQDMVKSNSDLFWNGVDQVIRFSGSGDSTHHLMMPNANVEGTIDNYLVVIGRAIARRMLTISDQKERWQLMTIAWMELLMREAKNSRANMHIKQLSLCEGDDLLTFIWIFIKHLNIDDVFVVPMDVLEDNLDEAVRLLSEIERHFHSTT